MEETKETKLEGKLHRLEWRPIGTIFGNADVFEVTSPDNSLRTKEYVEPTGKGLWMMGQPKIIAINLDNFRDAIAEHAPIRLIGRDQVEVRANAYFMGDCRELGNRLALIAVQYYWVRE